MPLMSSIFFQNASHEMQQSWNDTANQADQTVDSSQNAGMTDEQIDIANDLCGAEDAVDDRLGRGWEHTDFDTSFWMLEPLKVKRLQVLKYLPVNQKEQVKVLEKITLAKDSGWR